MSGMDLMDEPPPMVPSAPAEPSGPTNPDDAAAEPSAFDTPPSFVTEPSDSGEAPSVGTGPSLFSVPPTFGAGPPDLPDVPAPLSEQSDLLSAPVYPRRRRRRGRKWLILGGVGLCIGGAFLVILLTQGASGIVRFFTTPSFESRSGKKYTPTGAAKRYIRDLGGDESKE